MKVSLRFFSAIVGASNQKNCIFTNVILACGLWLHTRKCMRPKEVWEKPQNGGDGKGKRSGAGRKDAADVGPGPAADSASDGMALYSDAPSPANDSGQNDGVEIEAHSLAKHKRALSDQSMSPSSKARPLNDVSAMEALQRAIKSSPHKFMGSEHVPIEVEDLTPQPTRRILFPSPSKSQEGGSKPNSVAGSERSEFKHNPNDNVRTYADKENCPPPRQERSSQDQGQALEESPFLNLHSKTPTPTSYKVTAVFKTPTKSPSRLPPTTGDFFSSAAKALLRPPVTPKRTPTKSIQPLGELTPFTAHLNQLLSEANNSSPRSQSFDFPSLPSLRNTPGRATRSIDFDFSNFDSQDLVSTDVPMPSSPPVWFGVYEDPDERDDTSAWGDYRLPGSALTPKGDKT